MVVGPPNAGFLEADDYGYAACKAAQSTRPLRVYAGANDGMVHVFNGADDTGPNTGGTEVYAYIPVSLFNNNVDDGGRPRGLRALTFQDGGAPIFEDRFYVNASARAMDVDFANCGGNNACSPDWRTIVVGGLGKGGNTYYAIDATNTSRRDRSRRRGQDPLGVQPAGKRSSPMAGRSSPRRAPTGGSSSSRPATTTRTTARATSTSCG